MGDAQIITGLDAGRLRFLASIEHDIGTTQTTQGQHVPEWVTRNRNVWCDCRMVGMQEVQKDNVLITVEQYEVVMRWSASRADLTNRMRIRVRGKLLNIVGVENVDEADIALRIVAYRNREEV